jgi:hypothetical protein
MTTLILPAIPVNAFAAVSAVGAAPDSFQKFLQGRVNAIHGLSDADFYALPIEAQHWFNTCCELIKQRTAGLAPKPEPVAATSSKP